MPFFFWTKWLIRGWLRVRTKENRLTRDLRVFLGFLVPGAKAPLISLALAVGLKPHPSTEGPGQSGLGFTGGDEAHPPAEGPDRDLGWKGREFMGRPHPSGSFDFVRCQVRNGLRSG